MWFRLLLSPTAPTLGAMVDRDGVLFWRVADLGQLLNKKNPHSFARRFLHVQGWALLPPGDYPAQTGSARVVLTEHAFEILTEHDPDLAHEFSRVLKEGRCYVQGATLYTTRLKQSPLLNCDLGTVDAAVSVPEWIGHFIDRVQALRESSGALSTAPQEPVEVKPESSRAASLPDLRDASSMDSITSLPHSPSEDPSPPEETPPVHFRPIPGDLILQCQDRPPPTHIWCVENVDRVLLYQCDAL